MPGNYLLILLIWRVMAEVGFYKKNAALMQRRNRNRVVGARGMNGWAIYSPFFGLKNPPQDLAWLVPASLPQCREQGQDHRLRVSRLPKNWKYLNKINILLLHCSNNYNLKLNLVVLSERAKERGGRDILFPPGWRYSNKTFWTREIGMQCMVKTKQRTKVSG